MNSDYKLLVSLQKSLNQLSNANISFFVAQCNQRGSREYFILRKNNIENKKAILFVYHKKDGSEIYVLPSDIIKEMMEIKKTKVARISIKSLREMISIILGMKEICTEQDVELDKPKVEYLSAKQLVEEVVKTLFDLRGF